MTFDSNDNIKMILGVMVAAIVAVTVMLPVFSDIQAQVLYNKNNVGSVAYASEYTAGMTDLVIEIDTANGKIFIGDDSIAMPSGLDVFTVVAGDDFMVVCENGTQLSIAAMWEKDHSWGTTLYEARKVYDLDNVTISSTNASITVTMTNISVPGENIYTYVTHSDKVFHLSAEGEYGYYDRAALLTGVHINDVYDTLGIVNGPGIKDGYDTDREHGPMGFWQVFSTGLTVEIYTQAEHQDAQFLEWSMDERTSTIVGTVTDHGEYSTVKVDAMTYEDTPLGSGVYDARGYYLIAPLAYYTGEIEHAGMMMSALWILPILVFVGLAVVLVNRIRSGEDNI